LLDASNSMQYTSGPPTKMDYARYIAASLFYLAIHNQRDAAGLIVFDNEVREYIRPSTRPGQLARLFAGLERAEPQALTDFAKPLKHFQNFLHRRGIVILISDFYEEPETIVRASAPLRFHGNEVIPEYAKTTYRSRIDAHIEQLRSRAQTAGMDYQLLLTSQPLDTALREYLSLRQAGN